MLGWIEKVVPQPPVIPSTPVIVEKAAEPESKALEGNAGKKDAAEPVTPGPGSTKQRGVLTWLSKVVPQPHEKDEKSSDAANQKPSEGNSSQPAVEPVVTSDPVTPGPGSTTDRSGRGVLTWMSEGLGKVVPQPSPHDEKSSDAANQKPSEGNSSQPAEEKKEAVATIEPVTPGPGSTTGRSGRGVLTWMSEGLGKVVPQPHDNVKSSDAANQPLEGNSSQPAEGKKEAVVTTEPVTPGPGSTTGRSGRGVLTWLSEGLGKVVPQPSPHDNVKSSDANQKPLEGNSSQPGEEKKEAVATTEPVTPGPESSGRGVLTWLSDGLGKVVPHPSAHEIVLQQDEKSCDAVNQKTLDGNCSLPAGNPSHPCVELNVSVMLKYEEAAPIYPTSQRLRTYLHIALSPGSENKEAVVAPPDPVTPDPLSTTESSGRGVITWLSDGLGKVVPHPHEVLLSQDGKTSDAANQTEAQNVENEAKRETTEPSGAEGKPSSDISAPEGTGKKTVFNRLMGEFEKMIPQPENVRKLEETTPRKNAADQDKSKQEPPKENSPTKPPATPRTSPDSHSGLSLFPQPLGGGGNSSIFKRLKQGLVQAIPRPVSKEKPVEQQTVEAGGQNPGQEIAGSKGA